MNRVLAAVAAATAFILSWQLGGSAQRAERLVVRATAPAELRTWDSFVTQHSRAGNLRLTAVTVDDALPGRVAERFQQYHEGVRIWGAQVVRDGELGVPQAVFGELAPDLLLSTDPSLGAGEAGARAARLVSTDASVLRDAELIVLPLDSGEYRLAYTAVISALPDVFRVFVDANSGAELMRYSEIYTQGLVGTGTGLVGDRKKISVVQESATFFADDRLRPLSLRTLDMRANITRALNVLNGAPVPASERAQDSDNVWEDIPATDGHVHIGWSYDYFFKRHGRNGFNNQNLRINTVINAHTQQQVIDGAVPPSLQGLFVFNAFWCPSCGEGRTGNLYFGNGIPPQFRIVSTGQNWAQLAGALDIVGHEYTHGVTSYTSNLIPQGESGALNESFSDMMGTAIEYFFQSASSSPTSGTARGVADYRMGEDAIRGITLQAIAADFHGLRSMDNPALFGDPDHYSRRFTGPGDAGGIHINCGISNQAYFLAIEGGTNRTSGRTVQGVGVANREQIEKVFYRGFTVYLTPTATFSMARAATLQAAVDLYGSGSAPHRAVQQAWDAVGVL